MEGTQIDWTSVLIAFLSIGTFGGTWAYFTARARLASKEKSELQKREDAITAKWKDIVSEIQTQRISDRQLMQAQISRMDQRQSRMEAELALAIEAADKLRNELNLANYKLDIMQAEKQEWLVERDELQTRVKHLERIVSRSNLDTGPLPQDK